MALTTVKGAVLNRGVNVKDFGAKGDGVTDDTAAIQAAIDSLADGTLIFPPGTYLHNTDISVDNKNSDAGNRLRIEATGAIFTGTGNFIVDRTKNLEFNGAYLGDKTLELRAVWWSSFTNMTVSKITFGDAVSTGFDSSYWNNFNNCLLQNVTVDSGATTAVNQITFDSCTWRGNASQGFTGTFDEAFNFDANQNAQNWQVLNSDISYHNLGIYKLGAGKTSSDLVLSFKSTYFDTWVPVLSSQDRIRIRVEDCWGATLPTGNAEASAAAAFNGSLGFDGTLRGARLESGRNARNFIPFGDMTTTLTSWDGPDRPVSNANSATLSSSTGGFMGNILNINQALTTSNFVRFRDITFPESSVSNAIMVIRNADVGSRTIKLQYNSLFSTVSITDTEWTIVNMSDESAQTTTVTTLYTDDSTAYNVDIAYIGVFQGRDPILFSPSPRARTILHNETYDFPSLAAGATDNVDFTVTGAGVGDIVHMGVGSGTGWNLLTKCHVISANTVRVFRYNPTGGAVDVPSSNIAFYVYKHYAT